MPPPGTVAGCGTRTAVYVLPGGAILDVQNADTISATQPGSLFGFSLATGDFDGIGDLELAVGAPYGSAVPSSPTGTGIVRLYEFGGLTDLMFQRKKTLSGTSLADEFGLALTVGRL